MRIIFQVDDKGNVRTELFEDSVTLVPKEKETIRLYDAARIVLNCSWLNP